MCLGGVSLIWKIVNKQLKNQDKLIPLKHILALPTYGQKCLFSELQSKQISNFDLGHSVDPSGLISDNFAKSYFWTIMFVNFAKFHF